MKGHLTRTIYRDPTGSEITWPEPQVRSNDHIPKRGPDSENLIGTAQSPAAG